MKYYNLQQEIILGSKAWTDLSLSLNYQQSAYKRTLKINLYLTKLSSIPVITVRVF